MKRIVKQLPVPIVGLMLALAATGNLVLSYGNIYRNIFGILSAIILILMLLKIIIYPKEVRESLDNPVVYSVFPTFSMGIMLLSTYIKDFSYSLAFSMWIIGLILHIVLIFSFTRKYIFNFNIKRVFPSWFIVYVGIVVASVTSPVFNMMKIGQVIFWFGFISYLILLPIILKRVLKIGEIPEPALPTIVIFSAPASLCLAGYMNSFQNKNMIIVWFLVALSQLTLLCILFQLPKLLKLRFYPSYSAFTFPLVISAISIKLTNGFLANIGKPIPILKYIIKFEELISVVMVLYVLFKYVKFMSNKTETVK
ncbi:TDT family transporter [Anaerosalibacter bizertensis]|uniref:TDT family transporter n=1 Tax=Anaerosalibacter bizertensis TaxID=932217 RepID=A0A9Q4ABR7_9FIRM|nr:TDT family transporter [Anaerosalibacter bizertensis]MBV1819821.1 TDT family transporter [Bacteroidales bacterium MSK.15.36]MCG4564701.1 TDT family transporter [Anaerosalibacter bizertensis]MCG4583621.1 TDT family transporter [Anaerosalibacter bizertensis]